MLTLHLDMHLYSRQKLLLSLVEACGGSASATDFQKLLFLYTHKCEDEPSYKFVPYKYGCFSFQSYADKTALENKGMLEPAEKGEWRLSGKAKPYLPGETVDELRVLVENSAPERGDALTARVYREFPYYASRSEIFERVIPDVDERRGLVMASKGGAQALTTIGYEGDSIDGYLNRLIRNDIRLLCDVRRNPLSRKTGFSKNQLAGFCERVGIAYRHMPELGIPGHRRRELNTQADYDSLFKEYEAEDLPVAVSAVDEIARLLDEYSRIALTCFEKEPHMCHRHCVANEMKKRHATCPAPVHI